jgi:hypothetical protein
MRCQNQRRALTFREGPPEDPDHPENDPLDCHASRAQIIKGLLPEDQEQSPERPASIVREGADRFRRKDIARLEHDSLIFKWNMVLGPVFALAE